METDRNGLEILDREQCLNLLSFATIGRVGLTDRALPTVLPVNFHLDGERILIRTGEGSKLDAALRGNVVAFEADDFDPLYHHGWSVVVTGVATAFTDPDEVAALASAPLTRWAPLGNETLVSISTEIISGRRLGPNRVTQPATEPVDINDPGL